tara:strand:+ start:106 stop:399 length:294 start_codon:yes stop_codon:yes gene_type:complete
MPKKKKKTKSKSKPILKTKSERLSEVITVIKKIQSLGLTDEYNGISQFKEILKQYVNDGEFRKGKIKVNGTNRIIEYLLPTRQGIDIKVNMKYDANV